MTISEKERLIREINHCRAVLKNNAGEYTTNAIDRLIMARINLNALNDQKESSEAKQQ